MMGVIKERWLSGLRRSLGKRVTRKGSQVQILSSLPFYLYRKMKKDIDLVFINRVVGLVGQISLLTLGILNASRSSDSYSPPVSAILLTVFGMAVAHNALCIVLDYRSRGQDKHVRLSQDTRKRYIDGVFDAKKRDFKERNKS